MLSIFVYTLINAFLIYFTHKKNKKLVVIQLIFVTIFLMYLNSYHQQFMIDYWYIMRGIDANQGPEEYLNFYKLLSKLNIRS